MEAVAFERYCVVVVVAVFVPILAATSIAHNYSRFLVFFEATVIVMETWYWVKYAVGLKSIIMSAEFEFWHCAL